MIHTSSYQEPYLTEQDEEAIAAQAEWPVWTPSDQDMIDMNDYYEALESQREAISKSL